MAGMISYVRLCTPFGGRGNLALKRTPKYLRFTWDGADWSTLDALDQLDDSPMDSEKLMVAVKGDRGTVHIDGMRNGRRYGEWRYMVDYHLLPEQPSQEVLRDKKQWQAWCFAQEAKNQKPE